MRRFFLALLGFVIGVVGGYIACMTAYVVFSIATDFHDREGSTAMGVAFGIGPAVALVTGIAGAIFAWRQTKKG